MLEMLPISQAQFSVLFDGEIAVKMEFTFIT